MIARIPASPTNIRKRLRGLLERANPGRWNTEILASGAEAPALVRVRSHASLEDYRREALPPEDERSFEQSLLDRRAPFRLRGWCFPCGRFSRFTVGRDVIRVGDRLMPNWREQLSSRRCTLNNRMRASVHLFAELLNPRTESTLYITEQMTALYRWFSKHYPNTVGSEFLGDDPPPWTREAGLRHEDLTELSFVSGRFDSLLSFDVLEHVPDHVSALRECERVLRPGGALLLTAPFVIDARYNTRRAVRHPSGEIEHLLAPEYHGDPIREQGCLAFHHFGWELIDELRGVGFTSVRVNTYWSRQFIYDQLAVTARKSA